MTYDQKPDNKDPNRPRYIFFAILLLFLILVGGLLLVGSNQGGGWIDITLMDIIESFFDKGRQSRLDKRHARDILRLEALGGAEESEGLLEIAFSPYTSYENLLTAFSALGRGGRQEDVSVIIERSGWYRNFVPRNSHFISAAMGEIGGDAACRALNHKFIKETEDHAYQPIFKPFDLKALTLAVRTAQCLSEKEVRGRLERYARDPWVTEKILRPSLDLLADVGDNHALTVISQVEQRFNVRELDLEEHLELLKNESIPAYVRFKYLKSFSTRAGKKVQLLDLYLQIVSQWLADMPDELATEWSWAIARFKGHGGTILYTRNSSWEGFHESLFKDWKEKVPRVLKGERLRKMLRLLEYFEEDKVRAWKSHNEGS